MQEESSKEFQRGRSFSTRMECEAVGAALFVGGQVLTARRRRELKAKLKAGELEQILFQAVVYRDGPNRNHTRFHAHELESFAASFAGTPFLRNHNTQDIGARDGTVVESRLVAGEFLQTVQLSTERGMRDFLEGVIDRFSIGWFFDGVECSTCGEDWFHCSHWPGQRYDGRLCELIFLKPRGKETSAVNAPAVQGTRILEELCQLKEVTLASVVLEKETAQAGMALGAATPAGVACEKERGMEGEVSGEVVAEARALRAEMDLALEAVRVEQMIVRSTLSEEGKEVVRLATRGQTGVEASQLTAQLIEAQRKAEGVRVDAGLVRGIRPVVTERQMATPLDRLQETWNWLLGDSNAPVPPPSMRSVRDLYLAVTGDFDWHGRFNPEWSQLAAATTTTFAGLTVNALNKVVKLHYDNMATYRWYENIVSVAPHDGSAQSVQLIMMDGIANLPVVQEGAAYTEATVGDSKESMSFTKRGHYVGITLEAIRRSDIARIQAVPRLLVQGAIRSRSAAIAGIFTTASATGPTLADDSTVLFHANHGNTATTAFGDTAWAAARSRIWKQTIPGTSKPLGLWPKFGLFPIDLYDSALTLFGYGSGDVGKPGTSFGQAVNPYGDTRPGDPRPVPIAVPDWTDATNWAYIVDPRLHPVIHMAYANMPQGGEHALPEIFEVTDERSGLIFTNDTMPVKVRDWWSYGVGTYVGVGNNIVAG